MPGEMGGMPGGPMPGGPMPGRGMGPTGQNQPKPQPQRDEDVSKWKTADYLSAKKDNDHRLLDAVRYIAQTERYAGNEKIALVLIKLLTAEEPKEEPKEDDTANNTRQGGPGMGGPGMGGPGMGGPRMGGPGMGMEGGYGSQNQIPRLNRETIEAVIVALMANGTNPAKKALRDVVLGTLKTDDDTATTTACLAALVDDQSAENEAVLFQALTEAEKLRQPDENANTSQPGMGMMPGRYGGEFGGRGLSGASGKLSADNLRQITLDLVEPFASEAFRKKLAEYSLVSNKNMTPSAFAAISGMLMKPHPNNIDPQLLLFQSDRPVELIKAQLAGYFTEYSSAALGYCLGVYKQKKILKPTKDNWGSKAGQEPKKTGWGNVPGGTTAAMGRGGPMNPMGEFGGMGGMRPGYGNSPAEAKSTKELMATDPEMPARIAKKLWSPDMARFIGTRLAQASSLDEAGILIPLARTMPVDDVRSRLHRVMQTHWEDGSRPFLSGVKLPTVGGMMPAGGRGEGMMGYGGMAPGGLGMEGMGPGGMAGQMAGGGAGVQFDKQVCDPGFLVLVKMLPLRPEKNGRSPRSTKFNGRTAPGGRMDERGLSPGMGGPGMGGPGMGGNGNLTPVADWQKVHEDLLYLFCAAFSNAASINRDAPAAGALPIELHTDQNIVARYDVKWPTSAANDSTPKLDPVEIHYVRIAETGDPGKVWKAYSRALKTKGRMLQQDRVALLDTVKEGSVPDRKLSVDVLITRQQPGMAATQPTDRKSKIKPGEPLVVEILTIEIKDPAPPAPKATSDKADTINDKETEAEKDAKLKELKDKASSQRLKR